MPCEHYKDALIEAAAAGVEPHGDLRAHFQACVSCRAAFAQEQSLFAAIDSGLQATVSAEVRPSLLPRVRARLDEEAAPARRWSLAWAAIVASATLVVGLVVFHRVWPRTGRQEIEVSHEVHNTRPVQSAVGPRESWLPSVVPPRAVKGNRRRETRRILTVKEPFILVPAGQEQAIGRLLDGLRHGEIKGDVLVADGSEHDFQLPPILPLAIVPIEIKPLESAAKELR